MDLIDSKYIGLISSRLPKFKKVKSDLYNFRCPICGDSQKNKNKLRGYLYTVKNNTNFKCHNCGSSLSLNNFIKKIDPELHKQYTLEKFKSGFTGKNFTTETPKFDFKKPIFKSKLNLPKASEILIAKEYLEKRKLNPNNFYYAEKFKEWANTQKHTFSDTSKDEPRIIIPLYTKDKELFGFQGRSFYQSSIKYITIIFNDSIPKIYGMNRVDKNKTVYVTEGPFDSEFVENCVAMCGSDIPINRIPYDDIVFIFDNEPRNREICMKMEKLINDEIKIVIWPKSILDKDINDMVLTGLNVMDVIKSNTYKGLSAKVKFNEWKKV